MTDSNDRAKLIEYLYRVAVEPEQFDQLMLAWGKVLDGLNESENAGLADMVAPNELDEELTRHINQASDVLAKISQATPSHLSLETPILLDPNPALILDRQGKIITVNRAAEKEFEVQAGQAVSHLPIEKERVQGIYSRLKGKQEGDDAGLIGLVQAISAKTRRRIMLVLTFVNSPLSPDARVLITTLVPLWNQEIEHMLSDFFDLSLAESHVVQSLIYGLGVKEIAEERARAVATVRNQLKSVLRKTGTGSQVELVSLIGGLKSFTPEPRPALSAGGGLEAEFFSIKLPDGRVMEYFVTGDRDGKPVLFIHGMLDGYQLTPDVKRAVARYNLKLIAPARPGYSSSTPDDNRAPPEEKFADDLVFLLGYLGLHKVPVVGHMGGGAYAFALASRFPDKVSHIFNVSGAVPFSSEKQIAQMAPNHARMAMTIRRFPKLFPMFLRAGISVLERKGEKAFLQVLYGNSPVDFKIGCQPANTQVLNEGFRVSALNGHRAFVIDMELLTADWSRHCKNITCPITLIHGHHDKVVPVNMVRDFARGFNSAQVIEHKDAGQLVLYQHPDKVLSLITAALAE